MLSSLMCHCFGSFTPPSAFRIVYIFVFLLPFGVCVCREKDCFLWHIPFIFFCSFVYFERTHEQQQHLPYSNDDCRSTLKIREPKKEQRKKRNPLGYFLVEFVELFIVRSAFCTNKRAASRCCCTYDAALNSKGKKRNEKGTNRCGKLWEMMCFAPFLFISSIYSYVVVVFCALNNICNAVLNGIEALVHLKRYIYTYSLINCTREFCSRIVCSESKSSNYVRVLHVDFVPFQRKFKNLSFEWLFSAVPFSVIAWLIIAPFFICKIF